MTLGSHNRVVRDRIGGIAGARDPRQPDQELSAPIPSDATDSRVPEEVRRRVRAGFAVAPALVGGTTGVMIAVASGAPVVRLMALVLVMAVVYCHVAVMWTALRGRRPSRLLATLPVLLTAVGTWGFILQGHADGDRWGYILAWSLLTGLSLAAWLVSQVYGADWWIRVFLVAVVAISAFFLVIFPDAGETSGELGPLAGSEGFGLRSLLETAAVVVLAALPILFQRGQWWWWLTLNGMQAERHVIARRATAHGRSDVASELHDLQGHAMQVIALKSELAARLIDKDSRAAAGHLADVRQAAADAIDLTRSLARGHRSLRLDDELASAEQLLSSAGARTSARLEQNVHDFGDVIEDLLATTIMEGTTNVLRHARANMATIDIAASVHSLRLQMTNDGCLPRAHGTVKKGAGAASAAMHPRSGIGGLDGLSQRWCDLGGRLRADVNDDGWWELVGELPLPGRRD